MVVGICQTDVVFEDKRYNLIAAEDYIIKCTDKGAQLVLFPEMSVTGYTLRPENVFETPNANETFEVMMEYAQKYATAIGFGYILKEKGQYTNRYAIIDKDGTVISDYAKIHPFSYASEDEVYEKGNKLSFCQIEDITISTFICYDLRFPEIFQKASAKADLIVVAANWSGSRNAHWKLLLQARALENQTYVIGVNRVGKDEMTYYVGNSLMVDPDGQIIDILEDEPGLMLVDIDKSRVVTTRNDFPVKNDRREYLYRNL